MLAELVAAAAALEPRRGALLRLGAVEGQPVRLDALAGHAAALDQPRLDVRLHLERPLAVLGRAGEPLQHRLTPGDVRLAHRRQLPQQAHGRGVGRAGRWRRRGRRSC